MPNKLQIGNLLYRETPWDSPIFKTRTIELLSFETIDEQQSITSVEKLINKYDTDLMIYGRFPSDDNFLKKNLMQLGFYIAEYSAIIELSRLDKKLDKIKPRIEIAEGGKNDFDDVKDIANRDFRFTRFHEDPFIDISLANKRLSFWVEDLKDKNTDLLIYRQKNELLSFLLYENKNGIVDLILAGSKDGYGYISPYFWSSFLHYFRELGVKKIRTRISLSNVVITNIYLSFGFSIKQVDADYHWISLNKKLN